MRLRWWRRRAGIPSLNINPFAPKADRDDADAVVPERVSPYHDWLAKDVVVNRRFVERKMENRYNFDND